MIRMIPARALPIGRRFCVLLTWLILAVPPESFAQELLLPDEAMISAKIALLKANDFSEPSSATQQLGDHFISQGNLAAAEALYRRSIEAADCTPKHYLNNMGHAMYLPYPHRMSGQIRFVLYTAYPELIRILLAQNKPLDALEVMS